MLTTILASKTYNGNGSTTSWDYPFKIWAEGDLEIWLTDAAGAETQVTSNHSVTGVGEAAGGSVEYPVSGDALAAGNTITLRRVMAYTQSFFDAVNNQAFYAETLEDAIDRSIALLQQIKSVQDLVLRSALASDIDPELPSPEAGKVLAWNDDEDGLVNLASGTLTVGAGDIGTTELGDDAVTAAKLGADTAGDGLVQAVGGALEVNVDDSTIEVATDVVQVKAGGSVISVSSNDTTPGVLNGKLVAGDHILLTEGSDGGDETLTVSSLIGLSFTGQSQLIHYTGTGGPSQNVWTDLDISSWCGAESCLVLLEVSANDTTLFFRPNGSTVDVSGGATILASATLGYIWLNTDAAGVIEWKWGTQNSNVTVNGVAYIALSS